MNKHTLISVVGPTAIGKTRLAIELANYFNTEIISADSRQFYQEMTIGTAKPTPEELAAAPHHFIDFLPISQLYSAGDFEQDALTLLKQLFKKHPTIILVGGSGMYVNALTKGLDVFPNVPSTIRAQLNDELNTKGLSYLCEQLKSLDPTYYNEVDLNNKQRVIRALEVCLASGQAFSTFRTKQYLKTKRPFEVISIGLEAVRPTIYQQINNRVDYMMDNGLLEEATKLYAFKPVSYTHLTLPTIYSV